MIESRFYVTCRKPSLIHSWFFSAGCRPELFSILDASSSVGHGDAPQTCPQNAGSMGTLVANLKQKPAAPLREQRVS
jgi:hypothetical protein